MKYRQRLLDGLKDPEQFTVLKIDWNVSFLIIISLYNAAIRDSPEISWFY
jgi:hypothetical protein